MIEIVAEFGWHLVCPVFDAVVAAPGLESLPGSAAAIRDQFEADTGLRLPMLRSLKRAMFFRRGVVGACKD